MPVTSPIQSVIERSGSPRRETPRVRTPSAGEVFALTGPSAPPYALDVPDTTGDAVRRESISVRVNPAPSEEQVGAGRALVIWRLGAPAPDPACQIVDDDECDCDQPQGRLCCGEDVQKVINEADQDQLGGNSDQTRSPKQDLLSPEIYMI